MLMVVALLDLLMSFQRHRSSQWSTSSVPDHDVPNHCHTGGYETVQSSSDSFPKLATPVMSRSPTYQDVFAFLVLLTSLISLVVLPSHCFVTLLAYYVPHNVSACSHVSFHRLALPLIDH